MEATSSTTSATNNYQYSAEAQRKTPVKTLDKDAFLQLFVTQLQNQDPSSPQDTSEFISQMAQFTMLEQLTNMNKEIAQLKLSQEMGQASALIGHQVKITSDGNEISGQVEKVTLTSDTVQVYVNGTAYGLDKVTEVK
ncbi:MAG: Basal-body rod modification protein FlgD [Pelotomaculum sp. PtaB.Bin104]|nr:MAG: Basal-body rod modification protein FlgD [Pelotomaculum sp. PtaB.Bin104]